MSSSKTYSSIVLLLSLLYAWGSFLCVYHVGVVKVLSISDERCPGSIVTLTFARISLRVILLFGVIVGLSNAISLRYLRCLGARAPDFCLPRTTIEHWS
jgi:hypothetical protein